MMQENLQPDIIMYWPFHTLGPFSSSLGFVNSAVEKWSFKILFSFISTISVLQMDGVCYIISATTAVTLLSVTELSLSHFNFFGLLHRIPLLLSITLLLSIIFSVHRDK